MIPKSPKENFRVSEFAQAHRRLVESEAIHAALDAALRELQENLGPVAADVTPAAAYHRMMSGGVRLKDIFLSLADEPKTAKAQPDNLPYER